jgi:penicillin V acylase-like amidase (Ntn superfamily)
MTSRSLRILATVLLAGAALHGEANACTAVDVVAADGTVVAGRTMEWAFDMQWKVVSIPRGTAIVLDAPPALKLPATTVRTRHAMVGVAPGIIPGMVLLEGQNSAGRR